MADLRGGSSFGGVSGCVVVKGFACLLRKADSVDWFNRSRRKHSSLGTTFKRAT